MSAARVCYLTLPALPRSAPALHETCVSSDTSPMGRRNRRSGALRARGQALQRGAAGSGVSRGAATTKKASPVVPAFPEHATPGLDYSEEAPPPLAQDAVCSRGAIIGLNNLVRSPSPSLAVECGGVLQTVPRCSSTHTHTHAPTACFSRFLFQGNTCFFNR